jgi:hypothetical protein
MTSSKLWLSDQKPFAIIVSLFNGDSAIRADGRNPLVANHRILPSLGRSSNATPYRVSAVNRYNDSQVPNVAGRARGRHLRVVAAELAPEPSPIESFIADRSAQPMLI